MDPESFIKVYSSFIALSGLLVYLFTEFAVLIHRDKLSGLQQLFENTGKISRGSNLITREQLRDVFDSLGIKYSLEEIDLLVFVYDNNGDRISISLNEMQ